MILVVWLQILKVLFFFFEKGEWGGRHPIDFSLEQEITGDILLELNTTTLKELNVPTFGKRFKLQTAINFLRECGQDDKSENEGEDKSEDKSDDKSDCFIEKGKRK